MTCKECVHYEACMDMYDGNKDDFGYIQCEYFKDKSRFVEVVFCKDCKKLSKNGFYCTRWKFATLDNGYCNKGERKEQSNDR